MSANTEVTGGGLELARIVVAAAIVVAAVAGYYIYEDHSQLLRVLGLLAALAAAGGVFLQTEPGRAFREFARSARNEVRKVVWPTREETTQTTRLVIVTVIMAGLFFWVLDWFLSKLIRSVIGG